MRVIGICGSPRDGNSRLMAEEALRGCREGGCETELVLLGGIRYGGCCGRDACFYEGKCHVRDGLTPILADIESADALILASPSYFSNVTGLMKDFIDRTNPYCRGKRLGGKSAVVLAVGGAGTRSVERCADALGEFCRIHGITVAGSVCAIADKAGEVGHGKLAECYESGRTLVAGRKSYKHNRLSLV
jgi:multimeric flavodoxin WrbA